MKTLEISELKDLMGGRMPLHSGGTATCGSNTITITICNGNTTCTDGIGCSSVGPTSTRTKCCIGNICNP